MAPERSTLFRGARLVDPETGEIALTDVRVRGDRIAAVGRLTPDPADEVRELDGLILAPGFIDTHTHADCAPFLGVELKPLALASLRQGVTTQVCGNCGYSPFPVVEPERESIERHLIPALGPGTRTFSTLREWRDAVTAAGLWTNLAPLVGHGTLRASVIAFEDRAATEPELARMTELLRACLQDGAFGLSTGLIYSPGMFAPMEELVRLARACGRAGALYASHIRNETERVRDAVTEALQIGRRSPSPVHLSHHKVAGRANWGSSTSTLGLLDEAGRDGVDVTVDVYPYTAGSTALQALLPPWVQQGGTDPMLARLRGAAARARIRAELEGATPTWQNLVLATGWEGIVVAAAPGHPDHDGRTLAELAAAARQDPVDFMADLLIAEHGNVTIILHMMDERDVRNVLRWPKAMIGSDGILQPGRPHPRLAGTFPRVLATYVRQEGVLTLPDAIRRMTVMPARRFKIPGRGTIAPGAAADLVAFDPERIRDRATYADPLAPPEGIVHVMVNGVLAIVSGQVTGRASGRVLMREGTHGS